MYAVDSYNALKLVVTAIKNILYKGRLFDGYTGGIKKMSEAVEEGNTDALTSVINSIINEADPLEIIQKGMMPRLKHVGDLFGKGEIFLPEMLMTAESFQDGMKLVEPKLTASGKKVEKSGTVVFGTVMTDIHEIGKNIVITLMRTHRFEIHYPGANVSPTAFVERAEATGADSIAMSA